MSLLLHGDGSTVVFLGVVIICACVKPASSGKLGSFYRQTPVHSLKVPTIQPLAFL